MDSKTIKDKALKGLSNKDDGGQIASVNFWDIDEEEKKDIEEYIFNNPELAKKYFTTLCFEELESYFFRDDDKDYALPDNIKENYDLWLIAVVRYPKYIDCVPNHFLDAYFFIKVLEEVFYNGPFGDELLHVMSALGDTNLCSDIHFIKKLISIHNSEKDTVSPVPFWLFNYCSPELLKNKAFLQEFISVITEEINSVPDVYWCELSETYHWTTAISPDPGDFEYKIVQSGLCKDPDIQISLNKLKTVIEENFQMVEDRDCGSWLPWEEGHQPIDWINTMKFLCE